MTSTFRNFSAAMVTAAVLAACSSHPADFTSGVQNAGPSAALVNADLAAFKADPKAFMNHVPQKTDASGNVVSESRFSTALVENKEFVTQRDLNRAQMCGSRDGATVCLKEVAPGRAPFGDNDKAQNLVDNGTAMVTSLQEMESKGLMKAKLPESPWSDDYWPIYRGQIASRYADGSFPDRDSSNDWKEAKDYVDSNKADDIVRSGNSTSLDTLSPAEKYDLLIGDQSLSFTQANWAVGQQYYNQNGSVETWMGLCHGWSPASYMLPRPTKAITVKAADGVTDLKFFPADLRALGTSLWANVHPASRFIGGRCNAKDPQQDSNGRVTDPDCFDTNPATWHLAVVNQLGVSKRAMVMDATYDYEVWNQPVYAYSYRYYNPKTKTAVNSMADATIKLSDFGDDTFAQYRSPKAKKVVGIAMQVTYVVEVQPSQDETASPSDDITRKVTYYYDLELDSQDRIVGGEWYGNAHPDFLWTPAPGTKARAYAERFAEGDWDGKSKMNQSWQQAAQSGARRGQPLGKIVETLISASRAGL